MDYIPIDKDNIPEVFEITLGVETFNFKVSYNETYDFFTIDISIPSDGDEEETNLVMGEKLVLNKPLWNDFTLGDLPATQLVPMDLAGNEKRITWENLGETVFLYINDQGDDED